MRIKFPLQTSVDPGRSILHEAMDVAQSATQKAHYHTDVIYWEKRRENVPDQHSLYPGEQRSLKFYTQHVAAGTLVFFMQFKISFSFLIDCNLMD